jgi:hypothetical protein
MWTPTLQGTSLLPSHSHLLQHPMLHHMVVVVVAMMSMWQVAARAMARQEGGLKPWRV